jgi:AraC family transcriptional regulator
MVPVPSTSELLVPSIGAKVHFGDLRFEEIQYGAGLAMPVHTHGAAFLDLCVMGTIQEFWGTQNFVRGAATLNFLPIGAPHATRFPEKARTFQVVMNAPWLQRLQQVAPLQETLTHYTEGPATWIAARLHREFQRRDALSPLVLEGLLLELLAEMSRGAPTLPERGCPRWLQEAQEFLHTHFTESIAIEAVAAAVEVHPAHLMRSFRRHYGLTIGGYVRKLRIDYACHLLTSSHTSPAQVAYAVGFADQSHFHRTFRDFMGMTPSEFQKVAGRATGRQEMLP